MDCHVLTDVSQRVWVDAASFEFSGISVRKSTMRGGLSDGIDAIDVDNGQLAFTVLTTRGMALWRGTCNGIALGWQAPLRGPVHPKFVNLVERGGLGWLAGFDEWLCRCGLAWIGPPGVDRDRPLTLHGRIANMPAHRVNVGMARDPDRVFIEGEVEEAGLFHERLLLQTTYTVRPGSSRLEICDNVTNLGGTTAEMQLLYHVNQGKPLLGKGSRVCVPVQEMWPMTNHAAADVNTWSEFREPMPGFVEQVYCIRPAADQAGRCIALIHDVACARAVAIRWDVAELPCITVWKNTAAEEDGYVAGLEPATSFPRFKGKERDTGRVVTLAANATWKTQWSIEVASSAAETDSLLNEIVQIQAQCVPKLHDTPLT